MSPDTSDADRPVPRPDPPADPSADLPAGPVASGVAQPERRPGRAAGVALGAVVALTALGVPLGLLWAAVAPDTQVVKTAEGAVYAQPQPEQPIAADGWFSLLGLGFGVLAALALWVLLRRRRGPIGLLAGTVGGLGAALVAWQVGRRVGLSTYERLLAGAPDGQAFTKPADLRAGGLHRFLDVLPLPYGNLLLPAFGVAVTYTLLAGWSRWPSLRPEPEPDLSWVLNAPPAAGPPTAAAPTGPDAGPGLSSGPVGSPTPTAAPEPPAPGAAEPPRG
ncbi:hypothetical protein MCAG_01198 [Micromonospora sp. ATCC 39149]|uniref:DUF2567 domain-containing protein n=1 Tax=Micromonospora carbonacea TaxID=47853 RepID=A0A7D6CCU7_9ACTN|nr:DUF2567 domain-containing protein [Micromonospora sp. ATCC 39149]EEP70871.1 hypothetical protein MCAG_01198 [Micromonospora sp. ATCC 39149]QLJ97210.1 DUF2567 domain-containing protein [Micromonospora carbonacea]